MTQLFPNEPVTLDFASKALSLQQEQNQGMRDKIRKFAQSFAKEGTAYHVLPVEYVSIDSTLLPVLGSAKYKYFFGFNLKGGDGRLLHCMGLTDQKLESYVSGCYHPIP